MAKRPWNALVQHLRQLTWLAGPEGPDAQSDCHLLQRIVGQQDEAAFAVLVERHGPMVLGVCQRLLHDWQEAEDAFQATFCVLARKASAVSWQESIGGWLYAVACRVAREARARRARRQQLESEAAAMRPVSVPATEADFALRSFLDDELSQLPEKYRAPLVLCYLEGKTNEEAARLLGWPKGSVQGRLARGRELLRQRLTRRGLALSAAAAGLWGIESAAPAQVPAGLQETTVMTAIHFAAAGTAANTVPAAVAGLAEGVLRTMVNTQLKMAACLVLSLGLLGAGAFAYRALSAAPETAAPQAPKQRQDLPHELISIRGGAVDKDTGTAYVMNTDGGIDALDLKTGKLLWQTPKGDICCPLAVAGNRLVVAVQEPGSIDIMGRPIRPRKFHLVRVAVLDTAQEGKRLVMSEPLSFPGWARTYDWIDNEAIGGRATDLVNHYAFASRSCSSIGKRRGNWRRKRGVRL